VVICAQERLELRAQAWLPAQRAQPVRRRGLRTPGAAGRLQGPLHVRPRPAAQAGETGWEGRCAGTFGGQLRCKLGVQTATTLAIVKAVPDGRGMHKDSAGQAGALT
jgi:hypothetical protein